MKTRRQRKADGVSAIELAASAFFFVVLTLLVVDIAVLVVANATNNEACRDAARAAGLAPPDKARTAANGALTAHQRIDGFFVRDLKIVDFKYNGLPPRYGNANPLEPNNQPTVFVTTEITIKIPAQIFFFGAEFRGEDGSLRYRSSYLYPILNLQATVPEDSFDPDHTFNVGSSTPAVPGECKDDIPPCFDPSPSPKIGRAHV